VALNNKKGQAAFSTFVLVFFGGLVYFLGFAKFINEYMGEKIALGTISGMDGFFLANFNFIVAIVWVIVLILLGRMSV